MRLVPILLAALAGSCSAAKAEATSWYLKGDCANNGNGQAANCAAGPGAAGAFNSPANLLAGWSSSTCTAGDTLFIRAYDDNATEHIFSMNGGDARWQGGLRVPCGGESGKYVTVTNHPGEIARVANGPPGCTLRECDNATISTAGHDYVRIGSTDDLYGTSGRMVVRGTITANGRSPMKRGQGIVIQGLECTQGWETTDDGNWACIRLSDLDKAIVRRNFIHDIQVLRGGGLQGSASCIKLYTAIGSTIEYNTCQRVCTAGCHGDGGRGTDQGGGIDDKADAIDNVHRFNWIEDVLTAIRIQNQVNNATLGPSKGVQIYGNVIGRTPQGVTDPNRAEEGAIDLLTDGREIIRDVAIYNNTFYGWEIVLYGKGPLIGTGGVSFYNNIVDASLHNMYDDGTTFELEDLGIVDFNAYRSNAGYSIDGGHESLGAWRGDSGKDAKSIEAGKVCGGFVAGPDTNYHIAGAACDNEGRVGGVSTGAPVQLGAYGVTSCVGHTCKP